MVPASDKKELNEFVKIVSHDLSAPVRHIKSFHKMLMKDIALTDQQLELKGRVDGAITKLEMQLAAILALSRVDTNAPQIRQCNATQMVKDIIAKFTEDSVDSGESFVSSGDDIELFTDKSRLHDAYYEVLSNAYKFHPEGVVAKVSVTLEMIEGTLILRVFDQGIGIDERFLQDIYLPFRYLNHQKKYAGLGMGLTYCQKLLHSIEGTIAVRSNGDQGCIFTLEVPHKKTMIMPNN